MFASVLCGICVQYYKKRYSYYVALIDWVSDTLSYYVSKGAVSFLQHHSKATTSKLASRALLRLTRD